ncbi:DNA topoisomerase I [Candidatus Thorarchaeota archaeon]|nr:MAG: DNA topoisomerase I [Candidatus Thorarchaeota archaeon]
MVISEKPTAAKKIAHALDESGAPQEIKRGKTSYFQCKRGANDLLVVHALGHLYELKQTEKGWKYPRLETEWVPRYEVDKKAKNVKPIISLIKKLSKEAEVFVVATDYDIEGSLIGYLTLKYACRTNPEDAQRMRFSTLTKNELQMAFDEQLGGLDFQMIESGHVRHEIDWLYGINLTRALTLAIKKAAGWFKIVSTGRVQGPTLTFVAERDQEVNVFVPLPYWIIVANGLYQGLELELEYSEKRIERKEKAEAVVADVKGKTATVQNVKKRKISQPALPPFNLSSLQSEAYRHFGFKPSRTLAVAQKLYLDALISYPRTSSEKIPESVDTKSILDSLGKMRNYKSIVQAILDSGKLVPRQGKKSDPAHPAIHPTGEKAERRLSSAEKKVYDLVVRRFLAAFGEDSIRETIRADLQCEEHIFYLRGIKTLKPGWTDFYGEYASREERELPRLTVGNQLQITSVENEEKTTSPPARYNPSSLLKMLERESLGTKATRSGIVDSLKSRGYTLNDRFEMSNLGYAAYETLQRYVPQLLSTEFTRGLEEQMERIQGRERSREQVLTSAKNDLLNLLESFKEREGEIGQALVAGLKRFWKEKEEIGPCPKCGSGTLLIIRSPKTGKRFVGCSNYRETGCDQTYPLPQKGSIQPLDKKCEYCGHPMLRVISRGRSWETCVNWADCPGRQDDLKELERRRKKNDQ